MSKQESGAAAGGTVVFEQRDEGGSHKVTEQAGDFFVQPAGGQRQGPFESLEAALEAGGLPRVTGATQAIECATLPPEKLAQRATVSDAPPGHPVKINGRRWVVSRDRLVRSV
jgi:hypothetical protein